jgi:predicted nicotinamide N-methyase
MSAEIESESWVKVMYGNDDGAGIGQRLGINYLRSQQEFIKVNIKCHELKLYQCSLGLTAISGVVWDAGVLFIDYLLSIGADERILGNVLDLGTGTGICGISCLLLGARSVTFSDSAPPPSFDENISQLPEELATKARLVWHDWSDDTLPDEILAPSSLSRGVSLDAEAEVRSWDTIVCSDLLYDSKYHESLLRLLSKLRFKKIIFSYKKRHDKPEREFFTSLTEKLRVKLTVIRSAEIPKVNMPGGTSSAADLFIVIVEPTGD